MLVAACSSGPEELLRTVVESQSFDFSQLGKERNGVRYAVQGDIQYGIIETGNEEQVKFWFLTHHATPGEIGDTIYEFPTGEQSFCAGYHCCEVQFPDDELKDGRFPDVAALKAHLTSTAGSSP